MIEQMKRLLADKKRLGLVVFTNVLTYREWIKVNSTELKLYSAGTNISDRNMYWRSLTGSCLLLFVCDSAEACNKLRGQNFNAVWYIEHPSKRDCEQIDLQIR